MKRKIREFLMSLCIPVNLASSRTEERRVPDAEYLSLGSHMDTFKPGTILWLDEYYKLGKDSFVVRAMESWKLLSRWFQYLFLLAPCLCHGTLQIVLATGPRIRIGVISLSYELQLFKMEKFCCHWLLEILVVCRIMVNKILSVF